MKRTTGILILLALTGGCTTAQQGSNVGARACCDSRTQPVPGPAPTIWTENDHFPRSLQYQYVGGSGTGVNSPLGPRSGNPMLAMNTPAESRKVDAAGTAPAALAASAPATPGLDRPPALPDLKPAQVTPDSKVTATAEATVPATAPQPVEPTPVPGSAKANAPSVRMVNSKRITINYEIKDVGPSGLSGIELWYTQDGKTWKKRDIAPTAKPPYVIEVDEEGLYGFTLLARNGIGLAKEPPKPGDLPQVWVEVDMTKPLVHLTGVNAKCTPKTQNVVVRWTAHDKNLAPRPISISYSEKEEGPWTPIATNLENTGRYEWPLPATAPSRFLIRVEARDTVGNVGLAQTPKPVLMDRSQPVVSITTVEGTK